CRQTLAFVVRPAKSVLTNKEKDRRLTAQASCLNAAVITSCESQLPMLGLPRLQGFSITLKG
ncbi:hypothetical protein P9B82_18520, partial [Bacillus paralicheniformis]|nr:hypothetical protein [Bacillus paralicheniformis]